MTQLDVSAVPCQLDASPFHRPLHQCRYRYNFDTVPVPACAKVSGQLVDMGVWYAYFWLPSRATR